MFCMASQMFVFSIWVLFLSSLLNGLVIITVLIHVVEVTFGPQVYQIATFEGIHITSTEGEWVFESYNTSFIPQFWVLFRR